MNIPLPTPVEYRIDASDRLTWKNSAWDHFAEENGFRRPVLNSVIWDHITDRSTAHLYRVMVDGVRRTGLCATVPFRCDSPSKERRMIMGISPLANQHVQFSARFDAIREHGPLRLIDVTVPRRADVLFMCSWCKRVRLDEWVDLETAAQQAGLLEAAVLPSISHGICDACFKTVEADFD